MKANTYFRYILIGLGVLAKLCYSFNLLAQVDYNSTNSFEKIEFYDEEQGMPISKNYGEGPYLIYNCRQGHWACVDKISFDGCVSMRRARLGTKELMLGCAPFEKFEDLNQCKSNQMKRVHISYFPYYCKRF